jgi:hypothetical protein
MESPSNGGLIQRFGQYGAGNCAVFFAADLFALTGKFHPPLEELTNKPAPGLFYTPPLAYLCDKQRTIHVNSHWNIALHEY